MTLCFETASFVNISNALCLYKNVVGNTIDSNAIAETTTKHSTVKYLIKKNEYILRYNNHKTITKMIINMTEPIIAADARLKF